MRKMRKLTAVLALVAFVFCFIAPVSAMADETATNPTITAPDNERVYKVYQIFTGDLAVIDGARILSNVKWGKNGTGTENTLVAKTTLDALAALNNSSDAEKAEAISAYVDFDSVALGSISDSNELSVVPGYYLIKDTGAVGNGEDYSLYVVKVVESFTIVPKDGTTTSEKKVKDDEANYDWADSADYDFGDAVPFKLTANVASDYDYYKNGYALTFHDEQAAGLTFNANSVVVKVDGTVITDGYQVVTSGLTDNCTFEVVFANLKNIKNADNEEMVDANSVITVEYTSTLTTDAVVGAAGNANTSWIEYSNNPNGNGTGTTMPDTVKVFTYDLVVNKVTLGEKDEEGKDTYVALPGAQFTLTKGEGQDQQTWTAVLSEDGTSFTFTGLDAGTYTLTETVTPDGYNSIDPIEITITATHATDLTALTATNDFEARYVEDEETQERVLTGVEGDVLNQAGTVLPSTGGIGTTIFYAVGAALVLGAGVLLVTKRRMSAE